MSDYPPPDAAILAAGIEWLYRTVQPGGAILQHHGISIRGGERMCGFCPSGALSRPVISLEVAEPVSLGDGPGSVLANPIGNGEMESQAEAIRGLGISVREQWNGDGYGTGSTGLSEPAHSSLLDAVARYHDGCPVHRTVFCGQSPKYGGHACPWYRDGNKLIIQPAWAPRGKG